MINPTTFNALRAFRAGVHARFGARRDALFELLDAATVAGLVPSLAYLSLPAVHCSASTRFAGELPQGRILPGAESLPHETSYRIDPARGARGRVAPITRNGDPGTVRVDCV